MTHHMILTQASISEDLEKGGGDADTGVDCTEKWGDGMVKGDDGS